MTSMQHIKRFEVLKTKRAFIEQYWKDAYDATYPLFGSGFLGDDLLDFQGASRDVKKRIYDGSLRVSARKLASSFVSGLTPQKTQWFKYAMPGLATGAGTRWLEEVSRFVWEQIHNSNYDSTAYLSFLNFVIAGMFVMYVEEGDLLEGKLFNFRLWPLSSCYFADSKGRGRVDTVYRLFNLSAEQAVNIYSDKKDNLSDDVKKLAERSPNDNVQFLQVIYPRKKESKIKLPIASDTIEMQTKKKVREKGYWEMPVIVPRWMPVADSVYSLGPVDDGLPDHNTLNEVVKYVLMNADLAIAGMWGAVDDGTLNPKTVTVGPRKVIAVSSKDSFFPLHSGAKFDVASLEIERLQKQIKETMFADLLTPQGGPQMTAYEIHVRYLMQNMQLIPMIGLLQPEYLVPLTERCFGIALRAKIDGMPLLGVPPDEVKGALSRAEYSSPITKGQALEDVAVMDRFEQGLAVYAQAGLTQALDNYDIDEAVRQRAKLLGVPAKLIKDEKKVKELRDMREQKIQEIQAQEKEQAMKEKVVPLAMKGAMAGGR